MDEQVVRQMIDESREAMTALMREMWRDLSDGLTAVRGDVAELKTDVAELKTDVAGLKTDVTVLKSDVRVLRVQVAALVDVAQVHDAVDSALHRRLLALEERVTRLETEK